jgi:membrane fusion protein
MQSNLFRKQALEHQKNRLHGDVMVMPAHSYIHICIFLLIWLIALITWLATSSYTRQQTVQGWLEPSSGIVKIFAETSNGKIRQVLVREGEFVSEGQPLLIVNGDRIMSNGSSLETTLLQQFQYQTSIITEQIERSKVIQQMQQQDIDQQISAAKLDLQQLDAQIDTLEKRKNLLAKRVNNFRDMTDSGHISTTDLDNLLEQQLALQNDYQALQRERVNLHERVQHLHTQSRLKPQEYQNELASYNRQLSDIEKDSLQLEGRRAYTLRAPRAGVIANLQAQLGQKTDSALPLLSIVPTNSDIEAKMLVPVSSAGFIQAGQHIDIRYHAFPFEKFGLYKGKITSISDSIIMPNEVHSSPIKVNQPAYLIKAKLMQTHVDAYGKPVNLKAGMTLSADVQLSERSLFEWLLEPVYSLQGRI